MAIFTHVAVGTNDLAKARQFYDSVLAPLGYKRLKDFGDGGSCWGASTEEFMVLKPANGAPATFANGGTISFEAPSRAAVAAFHKAALAAIDAACPEADRIRCYEYTVDDEYAREVASLVKSGDRWRPGDSPPAEDA